MRRRIFLIGITVWIIFGIFVVCCIPYRRDTRTTFQFETTGHLQVEFLIRDSDNWVRPISGREPRGSGAGDQLTYRPPESDRPMTVTLTVKQAGLTTFTIQQWEEEELSYSESPRSRETWLREVALFMISAPVGTELTFPFPDNLDPEDVRLEVDHEADGVIDAELPPTVVANGDELDTTSNRAAVRGSYRWSGGGGATVKLFPPLLFAEPAGIYYSVYPSHPELQMYEGPFSVEEGNLILYGSYWESGWTDETQELIVPGGAIEDIQREITIDGGQVDLKTTVMGQNAVLSFDGTRGTQVEYEIHSTVGGIQTEDQAGLQIIGPDGSILVNWFGVDGTGVSSDLDLPLTGRYTIVIDPHLANLIKTSVSLSTVQ